MLQVHGLSPPDNYALYTISAYQSENEIFEVIYLNGKVKGFLFSNENCLLPMTIFIRSAFLSNELKVFKCPL